jgi:hypothetical protein
LADFSTILIFFYSGLVLNATEKTTVSRGARPGSGSQLKRPKKPVYLDLGSALDQQPQQKSWISDKISVFNRQMGSFRFKLGEKISES